MFRVYPNVVVGCDHAKSVLARSKIMANLKQFVGQYKLSKIIRFELKPVGVDGKVAQKNLRNYLSKKTQFDTKEKKLKLRFNNRAFAKGCELQNESDNSCMILKKGDSYYLAILSAESNVILDDENVAVSKNNYKKLVYRQLKNIAQQLPKLAFSHRWNDTIPQEVKNIRATKSYKTNSDDCQTLISFYKKFILEHKSWNRFFRFCFKDNYRYKNITEFYREFKPQFNFISFYDISESCINKLIEDEKIFLFQIYTRDFGEKSVGNKNLQTMYWDEIFSRNSSIKLLGSCKLFFKEVTVKKNKFSHDVAKASRCTVEKYFLHVPVKLNYYAKDTQEINIHDFNNEINDYFVREKNVMFLGIDRGERHLLYYSLIDARGKIIEQNNLDIINPKDFWEKINATTNIHQVKRMNLQSGYLSLAVHEVIEKMKDKITGQFKPTFIVLENLSAELKRNTQNFDQQVYQLFVTALTKKLNYLVDKAARDNKVGTVDNALQLTPPIQNYHDVENRMQVGIMFYASANFTLETDPETGWRKTIYITGNDKDIQKQIFDKFSDIGVDDHGDYFFEYTDAMKKTWRLWSSKNGKSLERYRYKRGNSKKQSVIVPFDIKREYLDQLFKNFDTKKSLLTQLKNGVTLSKIVGSNYSAWEAFRFVIDIIQQIKNSGDSQKGQDENFLLSPVRNKWGEHFDSRKCKSTESQHLPVSSDANAAYNLARKGIIMCEHIKQWIKDRKTYNVNLFVSDEEWDLWLSHKRHWRARIRSFACSDQASEKN
jgi:hypothetical protein